MALPFTAGGIMPEQVMDIENHVSVQREGKGRLARNMIRRVTTYDAAIIREQAAYEREFGRNGFSDKRTQRVIGEIPLAEFLELQATASAHGDVLTGKDLRKYLADNPEYRTVRRFVGSGPSNIIVR